ncbi:helix-turn-helix domain-containing protein [Paraburkholderia sp. Tr-20389]|uniref:AraC family transcriptional regulator n=1 Tax=Paraburkholderia sp. Tr-20389 TaxID=2703903 RepID=UPI00197F1E05|nr:helix-turn-helix domain-containing protein [Paraburkholderia sp. Tr-20389]MBN3751580.1 helix-turn-helix domain-containing protein [Paraburkholderia sp. Tr-20389]
MQPTPERGFTDMQAAISDMDGARDWMASICGPHGLRVTRPERLKFHQSGTVLRSMATTIGYVEYGTDVTVAVRGDSPLNCYSVSLPVIGQQELAAQGQLWVSDQDRGLIVSPQESQDLDIAGNCRKIHLAIPRSALQQVLQAMLQRPVDAPIVFQPDMDAITGDQASWWRMVKFLMSEMERSGPLLAQFYLSSDFELTLLKGLLLSQPHNYSEQLAGRSAKTPPHYLTKARQFIQDNAREPLALEDIERCAGVSRFKLFEGFKEYFGCTPMGYLKQYRLESVRREIIEDGSVRNISSAAMGWGISHLGRFSTEYKALFGESPSDTLKRTASKSKVKR